MLLLSPAAGGGFTVIPKLKSMLDEPCGDEPDDDLEESVSLLNNKEEFEVAVLIVEVVVLEHEGGKKRKK